MYVKLDKKRNTNMKNYYKIKFPRTHESHARDKPKHAQAET